MTDSPFIHLAVRSSYSLLESMITTKKLKDWLLDQEMPAVAITDRNNLYGALEISETLSGAGIQPIMACCFDVWDGKPKSETYRLTLYAQNEKGYARLLELSSAAYMDSDTGEPCLHETLVLENTDGLIVFTGGAEGLAGRYACKGKVDEAREHLAGLSSSYPGRCYVEITRHGSDAEITSEPVLVDLAYQLDLPLVATHDARFLSPEDAGAHDALMCISNGEYLGQDDRRRVEAGQYLKSANEMRELFSDLPEALDNTEIVSRRCAIKAETHQPILPSFANGNKSETEALREIATKGLEQRLAEADKLYAERDVYFERLDYELGVIDGMGFLAIF